MSGFTYEIIKHIAVLSVSGKAWQKELNLVKWGSNKPKYDIRDWGKNHEKMSKGISLTREELDKAVKLLQQHLGDLETKKHGMLVGKGSYECELLLECGMLSERKGDWSKEINIVRWGKNSPSFDLRSWGSDRRIIGKGTTLNFEEAKALIVAVNSDLSSTTNNQGVKSKVELEVTEASIDYIVGDLFI